MLIPLGQRVRVNFLGATPLRNLRGTVISHLGGRFYRLALDHDGGTHDAHDWELTVLPTPPAEIVAANGRGRYDFRRY